MTERCQLLTHTNSFTRLLELFLSYFLPFLASIPLDNSLGCAVHSTIALCKFNYPLLLRCSSSLNFPCTHGQIIID